jgi:hypothetical protein
MTFSILTLSITNLIPTLSVVILAVIYAQFRHKTTILNGIVLYDVILSVDGKKKTHVSPNLY